MFYKEEIVDGVTGVMAPTLAALDKLADVSRNLHPTALASLIGRIADTDQPVREGFARFCALDLPEELQPFRRQVEVVVDNVCKTFDGLRACNGDDPQEVFAAYKALRHQLGR